MTHNSSYWWHTMAATDDTQWQLLMTHNGSYWWHTWQLLMTIQLYVLHYSVAYNDTGRNSLYCTCYHSLLVKDTRASKPNNVIINLNSPVCLSLRECPTCCSLDKLDAFAVTCGVWGIAPPAHQQADQHSSGQSLLSTIILTPKRSTYSDA